MQPRFVRFVLGAGLLVFGSFALSSAAERDIVRSFPVGAEPSLRIDTYRGPITVVESDQPVIRIAVHLEIGSDSEAEAEAMLRTLQLEFQTSGDAVRVTARRPAETRVRFVWNERRQIEPTYRVTVPARCHLDLKTRAGSIVVGRVAGRHRAETDAGDIFFRHVAGDVAAQGGTGDVVISRCEGTARVRLGQGTIRVGTVTGRCELYNASGAIEVLAAKSDLVVSATAGPASVGIHREFRGDAQVRTSLGEVVLNVDPAAQCRIEARSSFFARVHSLLPLEVESGRDGTRTLVGRLNGGESRIALQASGGGITLRSAVSPFD